MVIHVTCTENVIFHTPPAHLGSMVLFLDNTILHSGNTQYSLDTFPSNA